MLRTGRFALDTRRTSLEILQRAISPAGTVQRIVGAVHHFIRRSNASSLVGIRKRYDRELTDGRIARKYVVLKSPALVFAPFVNLGF